MNNKFIKIFSATSFCVIFIISTACSTVTGAYSDDPYGPVVDCDSNLPMNELLKCVDKEYAKMDNIHESKQIKNIKEHQRLGALPSLNAYNIPIYTPATEKISKFPYIKKCNLSNKICLKNVYGTLTPFDNYRGREIAISNITSSFSGMQKIENSTTWLDSFLVAFPYTFIRSYKSSNKDIIIAQNNDGVLIFTAGFEAVKLNDNKNLLGIKIIVFNPIDPLKEGYSLLKSGEVYQKKLTDGSVAGIGKKYLKYTYSPIKAYIFWVLTNSEDFSKDIAISLDKRINPTQVFIKLGNDTYKIYLIEGGFNKVYETPVLGKETN